MKYILAFLLLCRIVNADQITLYYSSRCPYSQKVLSYLRQENIKIPMKNVLGDTKAKEELRQYGGYMVVPCLLVNKEPIYNANDIIDWISSHKSALKVSLNE